MLFRRKKKDELHSGDVFLATGIYLKQPVLDNGQNLMKCFWRCLVLFLLVFGSIGGFLSAFSISYNYVMVIVAYLLLAMFFSCLYSMQKPLHRDIGYIGFFAVFVVLIMNFSAYANSGFYAVINQMLERAQSFFALSGVRQYDTSISNDYLTIAIAAIFIGMVLIIVLNIWLYSTMSVAMAVILTFPVLLIPLYMKLMPDPIYLIALGAGYFAVAVFKSNGHYFAYMKENAFHVKGLRKDKLTYTQDESVFRQILTHIIVFIFALVILVEVVFTNANFQSRFRSDWLRENTSERIGNFILLGFSGLYNHYSSTGGMSGGKLGGVSNVRPDYQTDLIVTYAPYSNEAVYLKGYTGGLYGDNQWEDIYSSGESMYGKSDLEIFAGESLRFEGFSLWEDYVHQYEYSGCGIMDVMNVGADIQYMYYPYYTCFDDYSQFSNHGMTGAVHGIGLQERNSYTYYPKVVWEDSLGEVLPADIDTSLVSPIYLDVPEKNQQVLEAECQAIGLNSDMTENEIVTAVQDYFEANIPYTLRPGATPKGEDFVNYFLTKNRKGYCAHFASTATLLFRQMGIPARYVEGYAFDFEAVLASDENRNTEKEYSDYYQGYTTIGESAVMDVEVTDAMAHAWVEIYIPDFGWKVVEVTPGSNEAVDEDNFWDAFSSVLDTENSGIGIGPGSGITFGELNLAQYSWLPYVVSGIVLGIVLIGMLRIAVRKGRRFYHCHVGEESAVIIAYYKDLCDMIRVCDPEFNACRSHAEQLAYMKEHFFEVYIEEMEEVQHKLELISYSASKPSENDMMALLDVLKQIRKAIWKSVDFRQKIRLLRR